MPMISKTCLTANRWPWLNTPVGTDRSAVAGTARPRPSRVKGKSGSRLLSTYRFDYGPSRSIPDSGRFAGPFALLVIDSVAL